MYNYYYCSLLICYYYYNFFEDPFESSRMIIDIRVCLNNRYFIIINKKKRIENKWLYVILYIFSIKLRVF